MKIASIEWKCFAWKEKPPVGKNVFSFKGKYIK